MSRKLNIVFVLAEGGIAANGGFRIIAGYADRLQARGHSVTLLAPGGARKKRRPVIEKLFKKRDRVFQSGDKPQAPFLKHSDVSIKIIEGKSALSPGDIPDADILIATWWETAEWVHEASGAAEKFHFIQDHEIFPYLPVERAHAVHRLPLKKIVVSKWLQKRMAEYYDITDTILIENAIEFERYDTEGRDKPESPTVGFLYSVALRKNSALAIAACRDLKRRMPDLRAISFGSHAPKASDKMPKWVEYSLMPADEKIAALYSACTLWLFTSDEEGFGLPILEAMACGAPVVATLAGAAPDIITGENGVLVGRNAGEIAAEAERILKLPPEDWRAMSAAARAAARRRNWREAADELEAAIYGAIEGKNR